MNPTQRFVALLTIDCTTGKISVGNAYAVRLVGPIINLIEKLKQVRPSLTTTHQTAKAMGTIRNCQTGDIVIIRPLTNTTKREISIIIKLHLKCLLKKTFKKITFETMLSPSIYRIVKKRGASTHHLHPHRGPRDRNAGSSRLNQTFLKSCILISTSSNSLSYKDHTEAVPLTQCN